MDNGFLTAFVEYGTPTVTSKVTTDDEYQLNSVVLDDCYDNFNSIEVYNTNNNAWVGSITFSVDNKQTYSPMQCASGCTGALPAPTSRIVVDGDTNGSNIVAETFCLAGGATSPGTNNRCTVNVPPVSFIFLFIQSYVSNGYVTSTL